MEIDVYSTKDAIVLGGGANALGALRSLSTQKISAHLVTSDKTDPSMYSRYAIRKYAINKQRLLNPRELFNFLSNNFKERSVLIPTTDAFVQIISENRELFKKQFLFSLPNQSVIEILLDKYVEVEKIQGLGIPTPKTIPMDLGYDDILKLVDLPIIVKPRTPEAYRKFGKKNEIISVKSQLKQFLSQNEKTLKYLLAQEIVLGPDTNQWVCNCVFKEDSRLAQAFIFQRLSLYPAHRGVTSYAISRYNKTIVDYVKLIGKELNYNGPAMIEFKIDDKDGRYKYIEINPRLGLCNFFDTTCGINNVYYSYLLSCNMALPKKAPVQKNNVICIAFLYDLLGRLTDGQNAFAIAKLYMKNIFKPHVGQFFYWKDLLPGVYVNLWLLKKLLVKLK